MIFNSFGECQEPVKVVWVQGETGLGEMLNQKWSENVKIGPRQVIIVCVNGLDDPFNVNGVNKFLLKVLLDGEGGVQNGNGEVAHPKYE